MNIELMSYNLIDGTVMFNRLSDLEREVCVALSGVDFEPQENAAMIFTSPGMHFSWMAGTEPVAVGGFIRVRPGVMRTWFAAPDESWEKHGKGITFCARDIIQRLLAEKHAHRIETVTLSRHWKARQWYEAIGLRLESVMTGYAANGEDAVMFVATTEKP